MKRTTFGLLLCIFFLSAFASFTPIPRAFADLVASDVSVSSVPEIPGPNQTVTFTLTSYAIDLNRANIVWKVNGKEALNKIGAKEYLVKTGAIGTTTNIQATISFEGSTVTKTITLSPTGVDLLWQAADAYVPPFYRGKAMPSSQAVIKVVAFPQIKSGIVSAPNTVTYDWERNYNAYPDFSGYSKDSFLFQTSYLNAQERITGKATDINSGATGSQSLTLTTGKPQIIFYNYNPLTGTQYNKALDSTFTLTGDEATLVAEPYFFSPIDIRSTDMRYSWKLNGESITTPNKRNLLVIKKPTGAVGTASISLSIENIPRLFQSAAKSIVVNLE